MSCVSISANEPRAIATCRRNSRVEVRAFPSAMFDATDTAARRIWEVIPNISRLGNLSVSE
jgi:hypothetical protein